MGATSQESVRPGNEEVRLRSLLGRIEARDRQALAQLQHLLGERLSVLLLTLGVAPDRAADVVADVLFDVWAGRTAIAGDQSARCALAAAAYREGLRALAGVAERVTSALPASARTLQALPLTDRAVLGLVYGVGCSVDEVACVLRCSIASVNASVRQIRDALRR